MEVRREGVNRGVNRFDHTAAHWPVDSGVYSPEFYIHPSREAWEVKDRRDRVEHAFRRAFGMRSLSLATEQNIRDAANLLGFGDQLQ